MAEEELPPEPGSTPIPEGHVRLWHYTPTAALPSIREHGLSTRHAKGSSYGEPDQIWGAAGTPKHEDFYSHNYVEFHAHPEKDLDIGQYYGQGGSLQDHIKWLEGRRAHVTLRGDVPKKNIIGIHEPWHAHLRYLRGNKDYYRENPEFLEGDFGDADTNRAVKAFKAEQR